MDFDLFEFFQLLGGYGMFFFPFIYLGVQIASQKDTSLFLNYLFFILFLASLIMFCFGSSQI